MRHSRHVTLPADIHSITPPVVKRPGKVSIAGRRLFIHLTNFKYDPEKHYRVMRDRRSLPNVIRWVVVESPDWGRAHLDAVKTAIIKQGMNGVDRTLKVDKDVVRFYRQSDLALKQVEYPTATGLYVTCYTKMHGDVILDPNGIATDFLIVG